MAALGLSLAAAGNQAAPAQSPIHRTLPSVGIVPNVGQFPEAVVLAGLDGPVVTTYSPGALTIAAPALPGGAGEAVQVELVGGGTLVPVGVERLPGVANFLRGRDPDLWRTGVPTYGRVEYRDASGGRALIVQPVPGGLRLSSGTASVPQVVVISAARGVEAVTLRPPGETAQESGRPDGQPYPGASIDFATYLGGTYDDRARALQVTDTGDVYVAGSTASPGFPLQVPVQPDPGSVTGDFDAFIARLDPSGGSFVFSTFLGGNVQDGAYGAALETDGIWVAGYTRSEDFPTPGGFQTGLASAQRSDAFVAKLSLDGTSLDFASYYGGAGDDPAFGIGLVAPGVAAITGFTDSSDLPLVRAAQSSRSGQSDAYVALVDGTVRPIGLVAGTYLGGTGIEQGEGVVAIPGTDQVAVVGLTTSRNFPDASRRGAFGGVQDGFVAVIDMSPPTAVGVSWARYLGGSGTDTAADVAWLDGRGVTVVGSTDSVNFPTRSAWQATRRGGVDAFLAVVAPDGSDFVYSTFLGGARDDHGMALSVRDGHVAVAGSTYSANFPMLDPVQTGLRGERDAFAMVLGDWPLRPVFATLLGGGADDQALAVQLEGTGNLVVAGETYSGNFPTLGPIQAGWGGNADAFVLRLGPALGAPTPTDTPVGPGPTDTPVPVVPTDTPDPTATPTTMPITSILRLPLLGNEP